jgi:hypothetical protein
MAGNVPVRRRRQEEPAGGIDWKGALTGGLTGAGSGYLMTQLMDLGEEENPLGTDEEDVLIANCQENGGLWIDGNCQGPGGTPIWPQSVMMSLLNLPSNRRLS